MFSKTSLLVPRDSARQNAIQKLEALIAESTPMLEDIQQMAGNSDAKEAAFVFRQSIGYINERIKSHKKSGENTDNLEEQIKYVEQCITKIALVDSLIQDAISQHAVVCATIAASRVVIKSSKNVEQIVAVTEDLQSAIDVIDKITDKAAVADEEAHKLIDHISALERSEDQTTLKLSV